MLLLLNILDRIACNFFVVPLQGSQVFASFREFAFLHTLTNVPVDKGTLGVHEIEFVGKRGPCLSNGSGIGKHAPEFVSCILPLWTLNLHSTVDLGEIAVGDHLRRLVTNTNLEASRTPVNELNCALGLEGGNCALDVVWDNITTVQQASGHVFAITRITFDHLVVGLKARVGDLLDGVRLVLSLSRRDDWCVGHEREVDSWVGNQVGLELVQVDIERAVESKRSSDGRDDYNC